MRNRQAGRGDDRRSIAHRRDESVRQSQISQQHRVPARGLRARPARHDQNVVRLGVLNLIAHTHAGAEAADNGGVVGDSGEGAERADGARRSEHLQRSDELELFDAVEDQNPDPFHTRYNTGIARRVC